MEVEGQSSSASPNTQLWYDIGQVNFTLSASPVRSESCDLKECMSVKVLCKRLGTVQMLVSIDLDGGYPQGSDKGPGPVLPLVLSGLEFQANHL